LLASRRKLELDGFDSDGTRTMPASARGGVAEFASQARLPLICPTRQAASEGASPPASLHGVVFDILQSPP